MTKEELLKMKFHSIINLDNYNIRILRVFGGWIYYGKCQNPNETWMTLSTFVPEELNCNTRSNN